ncbi:hypothetical protein [Lyngbya confervoides]|uniref:Uncharacterized protein n=1 Tax=Lyngbya confervoides BDU141951 TaxID=1574623 RepID=A0ABD4SYA8_9CYAN|nr:hypothetical protein [Lyngbya confervoides]MCM1981456.1 hypothetical protein [Lyngbya confervoides BDU141951]
MISASTPSSTPQSSSQETAPEIQAPQAEKILCVHCQRTATNGIKCHGMCVADSDY